MLIKRFLWENILLILSIIQFTTTAYHGRVNLAQLHPCYEVSKRLIPYIDWTEKLASSQNRVQEDACGRTTSGPACCTTEVLNSYARSLGHDLKTLSDAQLGQLTELMSITNQEIDSRWKDYLSESRRLTISALQTIFGTEKYHVYIDQTISTLFNVLGNHQSTIDDVSRSSNHLFDQLILSSYRQFVTVNESIPLDDRLRACLITKASDINALPTQRELLYTLTSATSLIRILQTLFVYMEADIARWKRTVYFDSQQCLQRYARESLCPICVSASHDAQEPLCEDSCHIVMKTCFDQTNNPYVTFALIAQGYSDVIKQIQESVVELKLVERLAKLHIYLYDMVVNVTNSRKTYEQLNAACPDPNRKPFSPIRAISPTTNEPRKLVAEWDMVLHAKLDHLQITVGTLNDSLTEPITSEICSKTRYAVRSKRCTQIDPYTPDNFTQWPLPAAQPYAELRSNTNVQSMHDQLTDLNNKIMPIQQIIISLRPIERPPLVEDLPYFGDSSELENYDDGVVGPLVDEPDKIDNTSGQFSKNLYKDIDGEATVRPVSPTTAVPEKPNANHSNSTTHNLIIYLFIAVLLIIHRISLTSK